MDLLIKNGTLVSSSGKYKADIAVVNGVISEIGKNLIPDKDTKVVDAKGKLVLPGAIDLHTHLAMPFGGTVSADDYYAGTRAAVCGGTTTVFDFALQDFNESILDTVKRRDAICATDAVCDYAFHVGIKDLSNGLLSTMDDAVKFGVPTFKAFMVYDFGVQDGDLFRLLEHSKEIGARVSVHAENRDAIAVLTKRFLEEGKTSAWYHYMSRPEWVEEEADIRAINFAKALGAPLYIVHVGSKGGIEAIERAKRDGVEVYAETCPQYLEFTSDVYKRVDARDFVCSPPMKGKESKDALWRAINLGVVDTVATDHCPFQRTEKDWGKNDFTKIPNGCAGVENMYPYMLSEANKGKTTIETVVKLCSENPAKLSGCKQKGFLKPGFDADIVVYDPKLEFTITNDKMHSDCDHTIWEGKKLKGYPVMTFSRGRLVYENGEFKGERGWGRMVKRSLK